MLILFPFTDLSDAKQRPALLMTNPDRDGDFIAAAITSQAGHPATVSLSAQHLLHGSLPKPSWIRADKLFTFQTRIIRKHIGRVQPQVLLDTLAVLCPVLGCR